MAVEPRAAQVSLDDKYRLEQGRALIGGRQALVRLPMVQRELDRRRGLRTAGLISGYRGSPLGGYDMELWRAADLLKAQDIVFQPGVNEDLAMTALAGAQQLGFIPGARFDGVFGIWYGKGPGVDRSGDAIKHANLQGVSPHGGLILAFGDDHPGKSSTTAHQSDLTLATWGVPIFYPSSVAEILQMGLAAIALSRYSGLVVGLKLVNETAEATSVVDLDERPEFVQPDLPGPEGGVHARPEPRAVQERDCRLVRHKLPRAVAFARANRLDRIVWGAPRARFVIATAGKSYGDVLAALDLLGLDESLAQKLGLAVYKIALIFPLDTASLADACVAAREVLFVEEKRPHAEIQAKTHFFNSAARPQISGKTSPAGEPLLAEDVSLNAANIASALSERLQAAFPEWASIPGTQLMQSLRDPLANPAANAPPMARRPAFCAGCPHNTSTRIPAGSYGATGIGCHGMVVFHPDRNPLPMGHMGAEGAQWIGMAPFTTTPHLFQNLGDGTYSHSGSLAIRAAVLAGVNITFKILLNDAVAMTGGQPVEGALTSARVAQQVHAEGTKRIVIVAEAPESIPTALLPPGVQVRHRDDLAAVQEEMRLVLGVSILIYDQTCAAEKRRRRKIHAYPDPEQRLYINSLVCEGCGDCSIQSNCLAIQPLETELGRKRRIDQSACNKDYSCVKGFCPSFVTVDGGKPRRVSKDTALPTLELPDPTPPPVTDRFDLVIAGIGGTGVLTVSAVIGMAARIEGLGVSLYDMTGLSQKGGQVFSHVRLRKNPATVVAAQVGRAEADLVLACDLVAAVQAEVIDTVRCGKTRIIGNNDVTATADFQARRDLSIPVETLIERLAKAGGAAPGLLPASELASQQVGDSIAANVVMLGYAWQNGAIPLARSSIERAIELNGKAVKANLQAFAAGRRAATATASVPKSVTTQSAQTFIERRAADLEQYWNRTYAQRYLDLMRTVQRAAAAVPGGEDFVWAVARSSYQLMAYKDEYEVARLYSDGRFRAALEQEFESIRALKIHLAPPLWARLDPRTGRPRKRAFGSWILPLLGALAGCKVLRETPLDPFGWSTDRHVERELRDAYLLKIREVAGTLTEANLADAMEWARAPAEVRGYGPVKLPAARSLLDRLRPAGNPSVSG